MPEWLEATDMLILKKVKEIILCIYDVLSVEIDDYHWPH